jgi:hypothetical protein
VFGYSNDGRLYEERVVASTPGLDQQGLAIEAFEFHDNLMLEGAILTSHGAFAGEMVAADRYYTELRVFAAIVQLAADRLCSRG